MAELTDLSAKDIAKGYRSREFSAVDVLTAHRSRIEKENPKLNAFLETFDDATEAAKKADDVLAREGDAAHPLAGIPIATKDNILIKGKRASAASKILEHHVAVYDATAVRKLKEANAVFIGRTNMDEFAMGSSTEHSAFGPTRNPHDPERVPGGSSGGSAAAVASHMAPLALGSETCGSIRQPAALCGLVGMKPTYGMVSRHGLIAMGSSLDQIGPFARSVDDAELLFDTIRGYDPMDGTTLPDGNDTEKRGKTVGIPRDFVKDAAPNVQKSFERALEKLAQQGYELTDIALPSAPYCLPAYYVVMPAEVSSNLARFDGMRYGLHREAETLRDEYDGSRTTGFGPETRRRVILGTYVLSSGYYDAYYRRATALRSVIARELDQAFEKVSFIATPTAPNAAFKIGEKADPLSMYLEDIFAAPSNLTGIPAISVPSGLVERDGVMLPAGIQFMSPKTTDKALFRIARDIYSGE